MLDSEFELCYIEVAIIKFYFCYIQLEAISPQVLVSLNTTL